MNRGCMRSVCTICVRERASPHITTTTARSNTSHLWQGDKKLVSLSMYVHIVLRGRRAKSQEEERKKGSRALQRIAQHSCTGAAVLQVPIPNQLRALLTLLYSNAKIEKVHNVPFCQSCCWFKKNKKLFSKWKPGRMIKSSTCLASPCVIDGCLSAGVQGTRVGAVNGQQLCL